MNMQILVHIGLLYFVETLKLLISTVLVLNMFLEKSKNSSGKNTNIKANISRIQASNSKMCGYFCTGFIDFMLADKQLTDFTSLFSPYDFGKNDCIILKYFKDQSI